MRKVGKVGYLQMHAAAVRDRAVERAASEPQAETLKRGLVEATSAS